MRIDLTGKVALVTGSAHRVGKAIALELAQRGVHQVIHYNGSADKVPETVAAVQALGVRAISHKADLSDPAQVDGLFAAVQAAYGRLDILVNSASIFEPGNLAMISLDDWQRSLSINLTAPFLCSQRAVQIMRQNNSPRNGVIINICDESALKGFVGYPQHSVSKAGLLMLSKVAARSFAPDIRVNAIVPGAVLQPQDYDDARWTVSTMRAPLKQPGTAEDVARAVAYLVEEDYLTGVVLTVDGGASLLN